MLAKVAEAEDSLPFARCPDINNFLHIIDNDIHVDVKERFNTPEIWPSKHVISNRNFYPVSAVKWRDKDFCNWALKQGLVASSHIKHWTFSYEERAEKLADNGRVAWKELIVAPRNKIELNNVSKSKTF